MRKTTGRFKVRAKTWAEANKKARKRLGKKYTISNLALDYKSKNKGKKVKTYSVLYRLKAKWLYK